MNFSKLTCGKRSFVNLSEATTAERSLVPQQDRRFIVGIMEKSQPECRLRIGAGSSWNSHRPGSAFAKAEPATASRAARVGLWCPLSGTKSEHVAFQYSGSDLYRGFHPDALSLPAESTEHRYIVCLVTPDFTVGVIRPSAWAAFLSCACKPRGITDYGRARLSNSSHSKAPNASKQPHCRTIFSGFGTGRTSKIVPACRRRATIILLGALAIVAGDLESGGDRCSHAFRKTRRSATLLSHGRDEQRRADSAARANSL
jgi:hypothetical protein